jgi:MFS family permease
MIEENKKIENNNFIKWIYIATSIEYLIWGITDPLYALFVNSIVDNYFYVGLIFSLKILFGLFSLFFFTKFLKRLPFIQAIFISYILLFIVFLGFFIVGYLHSVLLLILISAVNGMAVSLDNNAKQTTLMNEAIGKNASKILGTNIFFKYLCWVIGMFIGGGLIIHINNLEIYYMYLLSSGFWIFQYFLFIPFFKDFIKLPLKDFKEDIKNIVLKDKIFFNLFSKMKTFKSELNYAIILCFFMEMTARVTLLFVPLLAKSFGLSLPQIFTLTALMLLPMISTSIFSYLADKYNKFYLIILGLSLSIFPLIFLSYTNSPISIAIASSIISLCLSLLQPSVLGLSSKLSLKSEKNDVVSLELIFTSIGSLFGGIFIGSIAELYGIQYAFIFIAIIAIIFLITAFLVHYNLLNKESYKFVHTKKTTYRKIIEETHFGFFRHLR